MQCGTLDDAGIVVRIAEARLGIATLHEVTLHEVRRELPAQLLRLYLPRLGTRVGYQLPITRLKELLVTVEAC